MAIVRKSWLDFWRRYKKNRAAVLGLFIILFLVLIAVLGPSISPYDPFQISEHSLEGPSLNNLLGTDNLGRDILSRIIYGTRTTLILGFLAAAISAIIGTIIGSMAGYWGGVIDAILMRSVEAFQIMPRFFLAMTIIALFGPGIDRIIIVIGVLSWPRCARLVRAQYLYIRQQEFVEAARTLGFSHIYIIFREIFPNAFPAVTVVISLDIAMAILIEASLSFLGLGDPSVITWGQILYDAQDFLISGWWIGFFSGLAIFFTVFGFNIAGDGLNDALNPYLKER